MNGNDKIKTALHLYNLKTGETQWTFASDTYSQKPFYYYMYCCFANTITFLYFPSLMQALHSIKSFKPQKVSIPGYYKFPG